ncbi:MAG: hypothetical protein LQ338_005256 [Usnochroma carphineum]|nr:MAG: hypothetical protein LQ338_005256 [Usnochroma carphineum]
MSSRKTPSNNPFKPLPQPDEDVAMTQAPQQEEMTAGTQVNAPQQRDVTAGLQVGTLQQALPRIPPKQDPSKKRPAQSPPAAGRQKFSLSMLGNKIKAIDALVAQRVSSAPPNQGTGQAFTSETAHPTASGPQQGSRSLAPVHSQVPQQDTPKPFRLKDIHFKLHNQRCALVFGVENNVFGGILKGQVDWTTSVCISAGRWGNPKLIFEVFVAKAPSGKEFRKENFRDDQKDVIRYTWIPMVLDKNGHQMIEKFEYERFIDCFQNVPENEMDLPFMQEEALTKEQQKKMWTVQCVLGKPVVQQFQDQASWNVLPDALVTRLKVLQTEKRHVVKFFFLARNNIVWGNHMPYFARRLTEKIPPLSQYRDEKGNIQLDDVLDVPSVKAIAGGIFDYKGQNVFAKLDKVTEFYSPEQFLIYSALTPIREAQFTKGRHESMRGDLLRCFVMLVPDFSGSTGNKSRTGPQSEVQKAMAHSYFVYVRLASEEDKRTPPEVGLRVSLEWDNSNELHNLKHQSKGDNAKIFGSVVQRDASELTATQTDFCILIRPRPWQKVPEYHRKLFFKERLPKAEISVHFSTGPLQRELNAVHDFCLSDRLAVVCLRNLLMGGDRSKTRNDPPLDLRYGFPRHDDNCAYFESLLDDWRAYLNPGQLKAIESLSCVKNNVVAIEGPPGTGKTMVVSAMLWLLAYTGTCILACAPSNIATDQLALGAFNNWPMDSENYHLLRLEIGSIEKASIIRQLASGETDESQPAPMQTLGPVEDDPRIEAAYTEIVAEYEANPEELSAGLKRLNENVQGYAANYEQVKAFADSSVKKSEIPYAMTMGGNIRRIMAEDQEQAEAEYQAELADTPEADRHKVKLPKDRNPSSQYAICLEWYLSEGGRIGPDGIAAFFKLRGEMEKRVFGSISMLFTTLNNSGSQDFQALGFDPKVIICDEAGQASLSSLCVPLAKFNWEATVLVGDTKQLLPTVLAKQTSEVADNSLMSPLEMVTNWADDVVHLTLQYRMAPSIASFPQRHIYGGRLKTHPDAETDNTNRRMVRAVAEKRGIQEGHGSEYWGINCAGGVARVEPSGTSLQNYANVDTINQLVRDLVAEGIDPEDISILCFYKAETRLIVHRMVSTGENEYLFKEVLTADAYQGREASVVIVDFVVAEQMDIIVKMAQGGRPERNTATLQDADFIYNQLYGKVTSFVKDHHRISVALTRPKDGLIIIAQFALFLDERVSKKQGINSTLYAMTEDIFGRDLVCESGIIDSHPGAERELRARAYAADDAAMAYQASMDNIGFVRDQIQRHRYNVSKAANVPKPGDDDVVPDVKEMQAASRGGRSRGGGRGGRPRGGRGGRGG